MHFYTSRCQKLSECKKRAKHIQYFFISTVLCVSLCSAAQKTAAAGIRPQHVLVRYASVSTKVAVASPPRNTTLAGMTGVPDVIQNNLKFHTFLNTGSDNQLLNVLRGNQQLLGQQYC